MDSPVARYSPSGENASDSTMQYSGPCSVASNLPLGTSQTLIWWPRGSFSFVSVPATATNLPLGETARLSISYRKGIVSTSFCLAVSQTRRDLSSRAANREPSCEKSILKDQRLSPFQVANA